MKYLLLSFIFISCSFQNSNKGFTTVDNTSNTVDDFRPYIAENNTIITRFSTPEGYERVALDTNSFAYFLRNFKLKKDGSKVHLYNGDLKWNQNVHSSILDIDVGNYDLQQCADAVMRLRAEYLFEQKRYDDIHFNLTNGFRMDYSKWRQGYRLKVNGNKTSWYKTNQPSTSYAEFRKYMKIIFTYAGTFSLSKELKLKELKDIEIGDVFIQGGFPGHAIIVMDVVKRKDSEEKLFMIAQSYMPAQDIHLLKNIEDKNHTYWYSNSTDYQLLTPEWTFYTEDLKTW